MQVLWVARVARFDLFRAVGFFATRNATWDSRCDCQFHRLMCCMRSSARLRVVGWAGDQLECRGPNLF
eukprot:1845698-Lingulodinium_polyedra.AAC.1